MADYPEIEGFAFSFSRAELTLDGNIYTAITNVSIDQPTEEEAVKGTSPTPLSRTEGTMGLGEGTITFSDDRERFAFLSALGAAYRTKLFTVSWVVRNTDGDEHQVICKGCRVLSNPVDHGEGAEALGGYVGFSFLEHTIDGNTPH